MKTTTSQKTTPTLRFPGFSVVWEEKKLGSVLKVGSGRDHKNLKDGNIPVFGTGGYMRSVDKVLHSGETVFIGRKGTINKPFYFKGDFWTVDTLFYTHDFKNTTAIFVKYIFDQINWLKYNEASGVPSLSKNTIEKIKINLPDLDEQNKIADFLSGVDAWIYNLKKQKENLESYKKGMMQKIFLQEMRFKDENGQDFAEWEEKKLGEVCKITTGKLDANAMKEDGQYRFYTCAKEFYKIDKFAFDTEALLVSGNGANVGYIHYYNGKFNAYQRTYILDSFNQDIFYIKYFLDFYLADRIDSEKKAGNTPYIVMGTLTDMVVNLPQLGEQGKISKFLLELDKDIENKNNVVQSAERWRQGLMQNLFI